MSRGKPKKLIRNEVGGLPIIKAIAERINLKDIFQHYLKSHGNEAIPAAETLLLLVYNLTTGKSPLYELGSWVQSIDPKVLGYHQFDSRLFNDDRFGRSLDKLYDSDRASMMTEIVKTVIQTYNLNINQLHNDSTSVKAYGQIPGKTKSGLELKRGHSKDHRPDLKQLVFNLSITADGAVPIHYKSYSGNRVDNTIHIETWNTLSSTTSDPGFIYVADSKLCTDEQLSHIVSHGGRAITIMPELWKEVSQFKDALRKTQKTKKEILRREKPGYFNRTEYFSVFTGDFFTEKRGYRIHWIYSSEKKKRDRACREEQLQKVEENLTKLNSKINSGKLKSLEVIQEAADQILTKHKLSKKWIDITVGDKKEAYRVRIGRGRPSEKTKYKTQVSTTYTLTWSRNKRAIKEESHVDGVFPLLSTDKDLSSKEVLEAYKYQPRLEKRFAQFKSIHHAAPLYFKKVERVEANMFLFFVALIIQALIEREIRITMEKNNIESLPIYPEERDSKYPTTHSIMNVFKDISRYQIQTAQEITEEYQDELNETQIQLLSFLNISPKEYWQPQI